MLQTPRLQTCAWRTDNWGTDPANAPGTAVTAGTSNAEGSWTQLLAGASVVNEACGFYLWLHSLSGTGDRSMLMDVGIDEAGGSSYTSIINNIVCGNLNLNTASGSNPGNKYWFPLKIKAGSSIAVRAQCSSGVAQTVRACLEVYGMPSNSHNFFAGQFAETIGTITNSQGTSFTPGNAANGSWTSLGSAVNPLWWFQLCYSIANATITAEYTYIELAVGDATNKDIFYKCMHAGTASETVQDAAMANLIFYNCYRPIPAGATIYIRGRCLNAPDTGYNAVVIGIGG